MKRFAILTAIMMLSMFCLSCAFADIINPESESNYDDVPLVVTMDESGNIISEEETEKEAATEIVSGEVAPELEVESGEIAETAEEESVGITDGKGGNPVGGIIAIVVVLLLVVLIAFLNRG